MDHLNKNIVTKNSSAAKIYNTNFAAAFYFFAFLSLVVFAFSSLSNILTPIAIAILIWFLINALANQIKKLAFMNSNFGEYISIPLSLIIIVVSMLQIGSFIASSMVELSSTIAQLDDKFYSLIEKLSIVTGYDFSDKFEKLFEQFSIASPCRYCFVNLLAHQVKNVIYLENYPDKETQAIAKYYADFIICSISSFRSKVF